VSEEVFAFSKHPDFLEWYLCYDDPSSKEWVDGMELKKNKGRWDDKTTEKWRFFYRPFWPAVGRPQRKMIRERITTINTCSAYIQQTRDLIATLEERIRQSVRNSAILASVLALMALVAWTSDWGYLSALIGVALIFVVFKLQQRRSGIENERKDLETRISGYEDSIRLNEGQIQVLEEEIGKLVSQIKAPMPAGTIERWFTEDIKLLEMMCLGDFVGMNLDFDDAEKYLEQNLGSTSENICLKTWGFLQPITQRGPLGQESTGASRAQRELGRRIETWQEGIQWGLFYRLWHIQFIFPLEKNLNTCSFIFDFVTRRRYGRRWETFQYNHVTNLSIREVDSDEESWTDAVRAVPSLLENSSLNALTFAASSGVHFRCAIIDKDKSDYFAERLRREDKCKKLSDERISLEDLTKRYLDAGKPIPVWLENEHARIKEEEQSEIKAKRVVQFDETDTARAMLINVRNRLESYVARYRHADE
jgi:hypothetical protein